MKHRIILALILSAVIMNVLITLHCLWNNNERSYHTTPSLEVIYQKIILKKSTKRR